MDFKKIKTQLQENFKSIINNADSLFITDVDKNLIWETYLNSFPTEERQEHTCNSCKQFLRPYGNVVAIKDNKLVSIWDFDCDEPFKTVAKELSKLALSAPIRDIFISKIAKLGTDFNHEKTESGVITWHHFHLELPKRFVANSGESEEKIMAEFRDSKNVFKRSLDEITLDSIETTLELIQQNSLYRGEESKKSLEILLNHKKEYAKIPDAEKENYCWVNSIKLGTALSRIRNHAIGTLLVDISEGKELDHAVTSFEKIMCPANYKRPNAIITKKMIEDAQKTLQELGMEDSLGRRYAVVDDITIQNVLFADRDAKKAMNVFEEMKEGINVNIKTYSKVEEVSIENFINNILSKATNIQLLMENKHSNNLMSVIAPKVPTAPTMFKWKDNFSWSYNNEVADSIKESVKSRGGKVDGILRFSISWADNVSDNSDLDAHCVEPDNNRISYPTKMPLIHPSSGRLDVDITQPNSLNNKDIVENIVHTNKSKMKKGIYTYKVHGYAIRGEQKGFIAEIEFDGQVHQFAYNKPVRQEEFVEVAQVEFDGKEFKIIKSLESTTASKEYWGISTNQFRKVSMMMYSPNYWDNQSVGNKHYFFILEGCKNPNSTRGFYNEFLKEDLLQQKRVFEALGSKMKVEPSEQQLSGLGFSSTNRNSIICKVDGAFSRVIKINF